MSRGANYRTGRPGSIACRWGAPGPPAGCRMLRELTGVLTVVVWALMSAGDAAAQGSPMDSLSVLTVKDYDDQLTRISPELQPLYDMLLDPEPSVRIKATQGLALAGGDESALLLVKAMHDSLEREPAVRIEAARGLGEIGGRRALEVLGIGLRDPEEAVRKQVVQELHWAGTVFAIPYIGDAAQNDRSESVRLEAVRMLRKIGTQFSVQHLADRLYSDRSTTIRRAAADALGEVGKKEVQVAGILGRAYLVERDVAVRLEIVGSLGLVREKAGLPFLEQAMRTDRNTTVKMLATQVYGRVLGLQ